MRERDLPQGLFPILDETYTNGLSTFEIIEAFVDADVQPFIVFSHSLSKLEYSDYIQAISLLKEEMDFEYLLHHHLDRMPLSGAAGIHLTYKSIGIPEARETLGPEGIIGYSARSADEALKAQDEGADYILLGSIFESNHFHKDYPIIGLSELKKTCKRLSIPVYASGGVLASNLIMVKDAGAAGFTALDAVYEDAEIDHNISLLNILWEEMD